MKQLKNKENKKWKRKITSRAADSFSVRFAQRRPFDPIPPSLLQCHYLCCILYSCVVLKRSGLVLLFCLNFKTEQQNQPKRFKTTPKFVTFKLLIYSNVPKCILVPLQVSTCWGLIPRGGTPYNGLYREAPPEMGTFLRLQVGDMKG